VQETRLRVLSKGGVKPLIFEIRHRKNT